MSLSTSPEGLERSVWRLVMWSAIVVLLALPMVAMRFTGEVNWTAGDFLAAAILLGGTGLGCEFVVSRISRRTWRTAAIVGLVGALLVVWARGAVGIV